jgi:hypothetical protein
MSSPKANGSPKASGSPKAKAIVNSPVQEEIDMSLMSWLTNTHTVLHWPATILLVAGLLVTGAFAEIAPRKSLEFLNNTLGYSLFFIMPFVFTALIDWPTGLLAAVVSLVLFARLLQKDTEEGFSDTVDDTSGQSTKVISNPHRWFIERMLGETPVAISSDRIVTSAVQDENVKASSSKVDSSSSSHK